MSFVARVINIMKGIAHDIPQPCRSAQHFANANGCRRPISMCSAIAVQRLLKAPLSLQQVHSFNSGEDAEM